MATTIVPPKNTETESRRSTLNADSLVADRPAHPQVDAPSDLIEPTRPAAPARYHGRWLDRLLHTEPAAPSPSDMVLSQVDPSFSIRSIQR